ncbi:MAG: NAD(P)/FAD-dependent oxidoreductase [Pseudomonadales bacterium]|nr:NAD(P)/FAD-dependent oxidoreductase [Pseudomonadales bacterium]
MNNLTKRIVIVGGGAGGAELATRLGNTLGKKKLAQITLIDANRTHIWKPRLHEVAAGMLDAGSNELSYVAHAHQHNFRFILGKMCGVNRDEKHLLLSSLEEDNEEILPARTIDYDILIIAVGSQTNDFGTKGAKEHCIYLDKREAAEAFHHSFLNVYLKASQAGSNSDEVFNIAIVGAGATGVELAAELDHTAHQLVHYGFDGIKPENVKITIVEAGPKVMPALSDKTSVAIRRQLESLDIQILTGQMVTEVTAEGLHTKDGKFIPARLKVWSAGVKSWDFLAEIEGLESNHIHQLIVKPTLQTSNDETIFAMGDCCSCTLQGSEKPLPPRAQTANQQATFLAKQIAAFINHQPLNDFVYKDKGSLISLSKAGSVGSIMGNLSKDFTFEGRMARLFYISLYRLHQATLHGWFNTALLILRDRINKRTGPKMKLH